MSTTRRLRILAVVAAVVLVVGFAACANPSDPAPASRPVADEVAATAASGVDTARSIGPTRTEHGIPVGWSLDQSGAEAAAAAFVRSTSVIATAGPLTRRDAILTMATSSFGPDLVSTVNDQLAGLTVGTDNRAVAPAELVWHEFPLTVTSTMDSATTARVRVWSVLVVGIDGGSVARQVWRTSTLTLEVERGDWKVAGWTDEPGPSPVALNDTDLASVADLDQVASWSHVGVGA
jgi:hypothetical protein